VTGSAPEVVTVFSSRPAESWPEASHETAFKWFVVGLRRGAPSRIAGPDPLPGSSMRPARSSTAHSMRQT